MPTYQENLTAIQTEEIWQRLEAETGGPLKDPTVYSASKLHGMTGCSWRYWLESTGAVPETRSLALARGRAVHSTIARLHRERLWPDWFDLFKAEWDAELANPDESVLPWSNDETEEQIIAEFDDAHQIVENYVERERETPVLATEVPFRMILVHTRTGTRYRLAGTVDQPIIDRDRLILRDLKTNATAPNEAYLARNYQFSTYGLALRRGVFLVNGEPISFGRYPDRLEWYQLHHLLPYKRAGKRGDGTSYVKGDLRGEPVIEVKRTTADYDFFRAEACRVIQIMRMKLFVRSPDPIGCSMCRYSTACLTGDAIRLDDLTGKLIEESA